MSRYRFRVAAGKEPGRGLRRARHPEAACAVPGGRRDSDAKDGRRARRNLQGRGRGGCDARTGVGARSVVCGTRVAQVWALVFDAGVAQVWGMSEADACMCPVCASQVWV
eukprot:365256-Chlamydomonas_euryale.AAC.7